MHPSPPKLHVVCDERNDLYRVLLDHAIAVNRFDDATEALGHADAGEGILILADGYPNQTTRIPPTLWEDAVRKDLRLYVEYAASLEGLAIEAAPRRAEHERVVVASDAFGQALGRLRILEVHDCHFVAMTSPQAHLVAARVAGFDHAVFGLPQTTYPILFEHGDGRVLVATTKLSHAVTGRYAPHDAWPLIWNWILRWVTRGYTLPQLQWTAVVRPSFTADQPLSEDHERHAIHRGIDWFSNARMLIHPSWSHVYDEDARRWDRRVGPAPRSDWACGDGCLGVLEGFSSSIHSDGSQPVRWWRRCDCNGEVAAAMALAGQALGDESYKRVAANLGDYLIFHSPMSQGDRADPAHPAFGLLAWDDVRMHYGYYADDNARGLLGLMIASSVMKTDRWNDRMIQALLAHLRLTNQRGYQYCLTKHETLMAEGWENISKTQDTYYSPHFQSYLWACYLWAYRHTRLPLFLRRAKTGIDLMMRAYPDQWRWTNGMQQERARMLLPLAWLICIEDTVQHRDWLRRITGDMLALQDICGAIREEIGAMTSGQMTPPRTNADYGTAEAPLIQTNGDPLADLLYTMNFAFLGLHEAAAATDDPFYQDAEDRVARFLVRVQARSETRRELDGAWFRAMDYRRWDYWASNSDFEWGAWCIETGWTQGWIVSVLSLRRLNQSVWSLTADTRIADRFEKHRQAMLPAEPSDCK